MPPRLNTRSNSSINNDEKSVADAINALRISDPQDGHVPPNVNQVLSSLLQALGNESCSNETINLTGYVDKGEFVGSGGFGDVYKAKWKNLPTFAVKFLPEVAIKIIRLPHQAEFNDREKRVKEITREVKVWHKINHENLLPFIGLACLEQDLHQVAVISPWMPNGTIKEYIVRHPEVPRHPLALGVAKGLRYLHDHNPEIIHGDLKPVNILVDQQGTPFLCDFGLSRVLEDVTLWVTSATHASGTVRWMAPELILVEQQHATKASDVYAYGLTYYEIVTGLLPFSACRNDGQVTMAVTVRGERPEKPFGIDEKIWMLWTQSWNAEPKERPPIRDIVKLVETVVFESRHPKSGKDSMSRTRGAPSSRHGDGTPRLVTYDSDTTVRPQHSDNRTHQPIDTQNLPLGDSPSHDNQTRSSRNPRATSFEQVVQPQASKDVRLLFASSHEISICDLAGRLKQTFQNERDGIKEIEVSPDQSTFVTSSWRTYSPDCIRMRDIRSGNILWETASDTTSAVAYSHNGTHILFGCVNGDMVLRNSHSGQELRRLKGHTDYVWCVAFSPDGSHIVSGGRDGTMCTWDPKTWKQLQTAKAAIHTVGFSPDSTKFVSGGWAGSIRIWSSTTCKKLLSMEGHTHCVSKVSFSLDGNKIVSVASWDSRVRIWNANTGSILHDLQHPKVVSATPMFNGHYIASGGRDGNIYVWDTETGAIIHNWKAHDPVSEVEAIAFFTENL